MAKRRTSVIQVMITGDASDLNKATRQGSDGMGLLGAAAITAAKVVTSALSGIAAFSIREFARFDQAMTQSQAIMGDLSDSTKKAMSDVAREVGVNTTFAAHEAADAFYFLASAGLDAEQSMAVMPRVAAFAQAGMFDLARATDILTDAQSALGMSSEDAGENLSAMTELSNVMVGAATLANASVEQFGEAFMRAGARIRMVGVPLNEAAAVLGAFADQGVKGAAGGEALSIILRDLPRAADRNAKAFRDLGIRVENADGTFRPMADIIQDFEKALGGLSATQQSSVFTTLGLTRSVADQISVLVGTSDQIRKYEADLQLMGDVTQEVADKQLQSFSNQLALTRAQFTNIALTIGEALAGPLRSFNLWLREQTPAIMAFVENAVPEFEKFASNAKSKFQDFKQFFDDNIRGPLAEFGTLVKRGFEVARLEFLIFRSRFRTFSDAFRDAIEGSDPEAAGEALGKFIAATFRQAFARVEEIGALIIDLFGDQPWESIGKAVGNQAAPFVTGFFKGLFAQPDDWLDEYRQGIFDRNVRTIASMFRDDFVKMFVGIMVASKIPVLKWFVAPILNPVKGALALIGLKIASLIPTLFGSKILGAFGAVFMFLARVIGFMLIPFAATVGGLFRTFFAFLGGATTARAMMFGEMLRTFFRTRWAMLLRSGLGEAFAILRAFGVRAGLRAIGTILAAVLGAFLGWPALIFAAAALAFREFIIRFAKWNEKQGDEYEGFGSKIVAFILEGVRNFAFFERVKAWFADRVQDLKDMIPDFTSDFQELGKSIVRGMMAGINLLSGGLVGAAVSAVRNAFNAAKEWLDSRSPSRKFAELGDAMGEGMSKGLGDTHALLAAAGVAASRQAFEGAEGALRSPEVPLVAGGRPSGDTYVINVTGAVDAEGVARQIERILRDSRRRTGGVLV